MKHSSPTNVRAVGGKVKEHLYALDQTIVSSCGARVWCRIEQNAVRSRAILFLSQRLAVLGST